MNKKQAGKLGGIITSQRYGNIHMSRIGRKGAETFWNKYKLVPIGGNNFLIVDRVTGQSTGKTMNGRRIQ